MSECKFVFSVIQAQYISFVSMFKLSSGIIVAHLDAAEISRVQNTSSSDQLLIYQS